MYDNCQCGTSCGRCKHKCKEYRDYMEEKETESLMQGNDRQPLKREHGRLKRL